MRCILAPFLTAIALVAQGSAACSEPPAFPRYDVEGRCQAYSQRSSNYGLCLDSEQRAYDFSKMFWDDLTEEQKVKCAEFVYKPEPMRYTVLRECVSLYSHANDMQRRQSTDRFRY